jgi:hypothetical protein
MSITAEQQSTNSNSPKPKQRPALAAFSITEFCDAHCVGKTALYALWKEGRGPRYFLNGARRLISAEAAAEWRARMETVFGWPLHISNSPNKRTLYNFPMQGNGAEMLRLATWRLCVAGIIPNMLIHDGILIEARNEEEIAATIEIMKAAGRDVCNGLEIGVDIDQRLERGARYRDKRPVAQKMWQTIVGVLCELGVQVLAA